MKMALAYLSLMLFIVGVILTALSLLTMFVAVLDKSKY